MSKDIIRPTLTSVSEALWQEAQSYGVRMAVDEQAVIARRVHSAATTAPSGLKPADIAAEFERIGLRAPRGYGRAVIARLERLIR